ncbi:MAG: hypothetical protein ACO1PZ_03570 [Gammaproteobacteria bacterium]
MSGRSLINIAGALLCLLSAPPGFAQRPALPQIQLPERAGLQVPSLEQAQLPIPDDLKVPSLEQAQLSLPDDLQVPNLEQAQSLIPDDLQLPSLEQAQLSLPDDLQLPSLEKAQLSLPADLQVPGLEQVQSLIQDELQLPDGEQAQLPLPAEGQVPGLELAQRPAAPQFPSLGQTQLPPLNQAPAPTQSASPAQSAGPAQTELPASSQALPPVTTPAQVPVVAQPAAPVVSQPQTPASIQPAVQAQVSTPPLQTQNPATIPAPVFAAAAAPSANADLCEMTTLDSATYPRAIVRDIQERLHRIYSQDPAWPASEDQGALRLTDGLLGPVTRAWMGRFCRDFHLERRGDVITVLPLRIVAIAVFADRYATTFANRLAERGFPETVAVLTSADFAAWVGRLSASEQLQARDALSGGPDTELLQLVNRYLGVPTQVARPEEPHTLYVLREDDLAELKIGDTPVPPEIVTMFRPMLDLEFPERDLLHRAAQNHLINNLGLCEADLAEAEDTRPALLTADQYRELSPWLSRAFPLLASLRADGELPGISCSRFPYEDFAVAYATAGLRDAIETAATETMPEYTHTPILWNGEDCGCTPPQLASTAYGIYPYWKATDMAQNYNFSIFSRVGYFGLEMGENGQLRQIGAGNANQTLLNDTSRTATEFITIARTYGSKVDWMIDRDWSGEAGDGALSIRLQLENLRNDIVQLLNRRPADPLERLRPLLSLGLAPQPFNGDGVTLYFRNFPNDSEARLEFEDFFHNLKDELRALSEERNRLHPIDHDLYVNLVVDQQDFMDPDSIFSSASIEKLLDLETVVRENLSVLETQERMSSVVVLLLDEPYYASLDTIYTLTHETSRSVILPVLISDFRDLKDSPPVGGAVVDSRTKKLDYLHESFGGAAFWPMPERAEEGPGRYEGFENYITRKFAPGANGSLWTDTICAWRWPLIGIVNTWLVLAVTLIAIAFFLYPLNCRRMPWALNLATRPVSLAVILIPPTLMWFYLVVEDPLLTPFWYPYAATLLILIIAILIGRALYSYMVELRRRKPTRVAGYDPRRAAVAGSRPQPTRSAPPEDDDADSYESFTAD